MRGFYRWSVKDEERASRMAKLFIAAKEGGRCEDKVRGNEILRMPQFDPITLGANNLMTTATTIPSAFFV